MKAFLFIFFVIPFIFFPPVPLHSLGVSPLTVDFDADPGEVQEQVIKVINDQSIALRVRPTVLPVRGTDEQGFPIIGSPDAESLIARLIAFPSGEDYALAPGEQRQIPIRFLPPADTAPGGYYAVISWGAGERKKDISLAGNPGITVAMNVRGAVREEVRIDGFARREMTEGESGQPFVFEARITNVGGRHSVLNGTVEIRDMFNRTVTKLPLRTRINGNADERLRILPGMTRTFTASWDPLMAFGRYTALLTVDAGSAGTRTATGIFSALSPLARALAALGIIVMVIFFFLRFFILKTK